MNFGHKENGRKKAFLANPKHQYHESQCVEQDCHANNKKKVDYYENPSLSSINIMNLNEENVFMVPYHEKKRDYYENPCLSHLMDEL